MKNFILFLLLLPTIAYAYPTGLIVPPNHHELAPRSVPKLTKPLPKSFSWGIGHRILPPLNQGACGNCWAAAATSQLHDLVSIRKGRYLPLSVQQMTSCSPQGNGCLGGWFPGPYESHDPGIASEPHYPWEDAQGQAIPCNQAQIRQPLQKARTWGYVGLFGEFVPPSVNEIKAALYTYGPLWVTMYGGDPNFQAYKTGVFKTCNNSQPIDHAVELLGWDDAKGAWYIKNQWGRGWGMAGYAWVKYGCNSMGQMAVFIGLP